MDDALIAVALLALASALIVAEIFIPSAGMLAIGMLCSLGAAIYYAWLAWWDDYPIRFWSFIGFAIVFLPGVAVAAFSILPRTRFGKRILLQAPTAAEVLPFAKEEQRLRSYIGQIARTITPLTPGGLVLINRERVHAYTEGVGVDADMPVEVIKVSGTRIVVREVQPPADDHFEKSQPAADEESGFGFDLPDRDN